MKITKKFLKESGFQHRDLGDDVPYEMWVKDEIKIWNFNGEHWLVDALDQGGIDVEFNTVKQLSDFFVGCRKKPLI